MLFWPIFGIFWCPVVTLVTFSSNLSNFARIPKKPKKSKKKKTIQKFQKVQKFKNVQNIKKIFKKNPKPQNPKTPKPRDCDCIVGCLTRNLNREHTFTMRIGRDRCIINAAIGRILNILTSLQLYRRAMLSDRKSRDANQQRIHKIPSLKQP